MHFNLKSPGVLGLQISSSTANLVRNAGSCRPAAAGNPSLKNIVVSECVSVNCWCSKPNNDFFPPGDGGGRTYFPYVFQGLVLVTQGRVIDAGFGAENKEF